MRKSYSRVQKAIPFVVGIVVGVLVTAMVKEKLSAQVFNLPSRYVGSANTLYPEPVPLLHCSGYALSFDGRTKNANWVYERLTADCLQGSANRSHAQFVEDRRIPELFRATLNDYKASGYDRGHLAPAADHQSSQEEMAETFFLSNMAPQDPTFNRGYWAKFEKHVRNLTKEFPVISVFTGPLYLPSTEKDGSRWVKYKVIGQNDVAVPTHFYKILLLENAQGQIQSRAYVLPNEPINSKISLESFLCSVKKVEKLSGIIFQKSGMENP